MSIYPTQAFFSNARVNKEQTKSITIRSAEGIPLEISGASTETDLFRIEIEGLERSGDYRLDMILLPQEKGQVLRDTVTVLTNVEGHEMIRIPVLGQIR